MFCLLKSTCIDNLVFCHTYCYEIIKINFNQGLFKAIVAYHLIPIPVRESTVEFFHILDGIWLGNSLKHFPTVWHVGFSSQLCSGSGLPWPEWSRSIQKAMHQSWLQPMLQLTLCPTNTRSFVN